MLTYELLGVRVNALTMVDLQDLVVRAIEANDKIIIANHNLHSVYLNRKDERMRSFFANARVVHIDGMPIVLTAKLLGLDIRREHRVTYVDWINPLLELCSKLSFRVMSVGGTPEAVAAATSVLRARYPDLAFNAVNGYFDVSDGSEDNARIRESVRSFAPNVLIVGMGMPRQEQWILCNLDQLDANVILPAGACMDYVGGVVPTPPRWAGKLGLEWLFRLVADPRRLGRRYLIEPWALLPLFWRDVMRYRVRRPS